MLNEYEITKIAAAHDGQGAWNLPAEPTPADWQRRARLQLMQSASVTWPGVVTAWLGYMDAMARHPGFKAQAEDAEVEVRRAWATAEIAELEAERASIDLKAWGLSANEAATARVLAGTESPKQPGGYDLTRNRAALELQTGVVALQGFIDDARRLKEIERRLIERKARLSSMATTAEIASVERKAKIAAAKAERKALAKAEPVLA